MYSILVAIELNGLFQCLANINMIRKYLQSASPSTGIFKIEKIVKNLFYNLKLKLALVINIIKCSILDQCLFLMALNNRM